MSAAVPLCGIRTRSSQVQLPPPRPFRMVGRAVMPRSRKPSEPPGCVGAIPTPSANFQTLNERKSHENHHPIPKPIALSPELQAESRHSHPTDGATKPRVPPGQALRRETAINLRLVAQKQSARLISERSRSVTARDDHLPSARCRVRSIRQKPYEPG